jgi:hypothetical protein
MIIYKMMVLISMYGHRRTPMVLSEQTTAREQQTYVVFYWGGGFETGFLCIALAVLELTLCRPGLASNSEIHLPLPPECWD